MMRRANMIGLCGLLAAGCATPAGVRNSAKMTSDSLGVVERELDRFSIESRKQADIKAKRIAALQRHNRGLRDDLTHATKLYASIGGEEGQWVPIYQDLAAAADGFAKDDADSTAAHEALMAALQAAHTNLPLPSEPLRDAAVRYAKLAEPASLGTQLSFLQGYSRCTVYGIELARAQAAGKTGDSLPKKPEVCSSFSQ
jgi:hypothetical protein